MKILKIGRINKNVFRGSCIKCGCEVETEENEAEWIEDRPNDGALKVNCPNCDNKFLWVRKV